MTEHRHLEAPLSWSQRRLLLILLAEDEIKEETTAWRTKSGRIIFHRTVESLFDRYLVRVVWEFGRKYHVAKLTDTGACVARDIAQHEREKMLSPHNSKRKLSEKAKLLIQELIS